MANKLFLGGVSPNTTTEMLREHFGKYGPISDAIVMMKDGKSRGFGFVTYESPESIPLVLAEEQIIDDRTIDVKQAVPQGGGAQAYGVMPGRMPYGAIAQPAFIPFGGPVPTTPSRAVVGPQACDKVFIGGLPQTTADETVRDYFAQYGNIIDCVVMKDKESGRSRGFGFVQYDNTDSVEAVIRDYAKHTIDGKWIEAKKAVPQNKGAGKGAAGGGAYVTAASAGKGAQQYFDPAAYAAAYGGAYSAAPPNYAALGYDAAAAYASFYGAPAAAAFGAYGAYGAAPTSAAAYAAAARAAPGAAGRARPY